MTYRYIKFSVTKRRGGGSGYIQLSELRFLNADDEIFVWPSGTTITATSSATGSYESVEKLIDGNTSTKYCGSTPGYVTFEIDLGESGSIDISIYRTWQWYTANDATDRDPISFSLSLSEDGVEYIEFDSVSDAEVTTTRSALAYEGMIKPLYERRYLIGDASGKLYTIAEEALVELSETSLSKALFLSDGLEDEPDGSLLLGLVNPRIYFWQDSTDALPTIRITAKETPNAQKVVTENVHLSHSTIVGVEKVTIDSDDTTLFAVSFDDGVTWWNYINDTWALLSEELSGQTRESIEGIGTDAWGQKVTAGGTIKFRFVISGDGYMNSITIHYLN